MNAKSRPDDEAEASLNDRAFAAVAKALADPRRFGILTEIASAKEPLPCCALSDSEKVTPATISHHVKELETAGLIGTVRRGKFVELVFQRTTLEAYLKQLTAALLPEP